MKIKEIIWLKEFADKIEWKHGVTEDEVDEVLDKQPPVRKMARGSGRERISIAQSSKRMLVDICRSFSFTRDENER
jgi:hypothetical protein